MSLRVTPEKSLDISLIFGGFENPDNYWSLSDPTKGLWEQQVCSEYSSYGHWFNKHNGVVAPS